MVEATIPVDLHNPGQVLACLGLLEAAEILCGDARAGFDWDVDPALFVLAADGLSNPIEAALGFIEKAVASELAPVGWVEPAKIEITGGRTEFVGLRGTVIGEEMNLIRVLLDKPVNIPGVGTVRVDLWPTNFLKWRGKRREQAPLFSIEFPARKGENLSLPVTLKNSNEFCLMLSHWADGSSTDSFKLYSGSRSAFKVVGDMQSLIRQLLAADRCGVTADPFAATCPMGGSFNFDPRGAWNALDAGYSPNRLGHSVVASPVVELFAAIGLENSRPIRHSTFAYSYRAWAELLPASMARCAFAVPLPGVRARAFGLLLFRPNENSRAITYAEEATHS